MGFNILPAFQNQLKAMEEKRGAGVAAGLGLAALLAAGQADAATEAFQLADKDGRFGVIALLFVPALGWVSRRRAALGLVLRRILLANSLRSHFNWHLY